MGIRNYLIEGLSGSGKTTVAKELERRGHHVIHGDRTLAYYGDPATGESLERPALEGEAERIAWDYPRWIWSVEKVKTLVADQAMLMTFFCGGSRNSQRFIDLFDAVFVLEVDFETLDRRMATRPEDVFGAGRSNGSGFGNSTSARGTIPSRRAHRRQKTRRADRGRHYFEVHRSPLSLRVPARLTIFATFASYTGRIRPLKDRHELDR